MIYVHPEPNTNIQFRPQTTHIPDTKLNRKEVKRYY